MIPGKQIAKHDWKMWDELESFYLGGSPRPAAISLLSERLLFATHYSLKSLDAQLRFSFRECLPIVYTKEVIDK